MIQAYKVVRGVNIVDVCQLKNHLIKLLYRNESFSFDDCAIAISVKYKISSKNASYHIYLSLKRNAIAATIITALHPFGFKIAERYRVG